MSNKTDKAIVEVTEGSMAFKTWIRKLKMDFAGSVHVIDQTNGEDEAERMKDALRRLMEDLIEAI